MRTWEKDSATNNGRHRGNKQEKKQLYENFVLHPTYQFSAALTYSREREKQDAATASG